MWKAVFFPLWCEITLAHFIITSKRLEESVFVKCGKKYLIRFYLCMESRSITISQENLNDIGDHLMLMISFSRTRKKKERLKVSEGEVVRNMEGKKKIARKKTNKKESKQEIS